MKKHLVMASLLLILLSLTAGTTASAYPIGCWYTGSSHVDSSYSCNFPWCEQGGGPDDDAEFLTTYNQWQCPDGSTGYDSTYRFNQCMIVPHCG